MIKAMLRCGGTARSWTASLIAACALVLVPAAAFAHDDDHDHEADAVDVHSTPSGSTEVMPLALAPQRPRPGASAKNRYSLAGGCFAVRSRSQNAFLAREGDAYTATARSSGAGERFRLQATRLGSYLLYDSQGRFLSIDPSGSKAANDPSQVGSQPRATVWADWTVRRRGAGTFHLTSPSASKVIAADGEGRLLLAEPGAAGATERFSFVAVGGCAGFPEIALNVSGSPHTGNPRYGEARGLIDLHAHIMAFHAFGQNLHCGRPWHPFGVAHALVDCPDHAPMGLGALVENIAAHGNPTRTHHPDGWPTFEGWPTWDSFTHEQTYHRWIERTWRAGLRIKVMLAVDNSSLCLVNPHKSDSVCNEMDSVRRQLRDVKAMQDYIDAQSGGPGKGWFRIVKNPFQARRVINDGKLAVILGIEVSEPLDCGIRNGEPQCDREQIERELDAVHRAGVRQMELVNKFDNALSGVAMDGGINGPIVNTGNKAATGRFWDVETCAADEESDNTQDTSLPSIGPSDDLIAGGLRALMPVLDLPVYPPPPHCNTRGLTDLGAHAIREMAKRGMIFDPDHMSARARKSAIDLVERMGYSGIVSSHSWADRTSYRRIFELGGVVTPMAKSPESYVRQWEQRREDHAEARDGDPFGFATGFGDDMNGFASQGQPTGGGDAQINYPFKSLDGGVTVRRQQSGTKTFDMNRDGIAHFGLFADWAEGVRRAGGRQVARDLQVGPEAYLRMWERAVGVRGPRCVGRGATFARRGVGPLRLGLRPQRLLRRAGQPERRTRAWQWCVGGGGRATAVFRPNRRVGLVLSNSPRHRAGGVRRGNRAAAVRGRASSRGRGVFTRRAGRGGSRFVYVVRSGRVRAVGVASAATARNTRQLVRQVRLAGIR